MGLLHHPVWLKLDLTLLGIPFKRFELLLWSTSVDSIAFGEHQNFPCLKLIEIVVLWVYYTIPFGFSLFWHFLVITIQLFYTTCLAKDHGRGFSTRNAHMVHIVNLIRLEMVYTSSKKSLLVFEFVWRRITDEGSVPEINIWSTLLIKSDLKWYIHLSRSLYSYFSYLLSVTADGPWSSRGHV